MDDDQSLAASRAQRELNAESESAALHSRAKLVFFALLDHPEAARAAALERLCQDDPALRAEVSSLLGHHRHESLISASPQNSALPDGGTSPAQSSSPVGTQIGGILVERVVGKGGMSTVYLGYDARLGRRVALKALRKSGGSDQETRSRFLREARVLSRLEHANICEIYGYEKTVEGDFLILEYIDGRSLREVQTEALPLRERDRIAGAIADALQVAHAAGVVHRDLKPENVMLTQDGQVKVLDFGIARLERGEDLAAGAAPALGSSPSAESGPDAASEIGPLTHQGRILGTPHYMSPEQARGEPISPASDIFSLGLLLCEIYLGRSAYPNDLPHPVMIERVQKGLVAPVDGLSRNRKRLLQRMLSADAASRPTVTEVAQALRHIRDRRARLLLRGAIAALLAVIVLVGVNYVLAVTRAWTQAEAARSQLDVLADTLIDDMFNRLSLRDRRAMLDRFGRLPLIVLPELPDRLLHESVFRFASRVGTTGRMRLLTGDTLGTEAAFLRMLRFDELNVSAQGNVYLRRELTAQLTQIVSADEGRAAPRSALATYEQASAFYVRQLAGGRDTERWRSRLAMVSLPLGWTYLQSGDLPAARAAFARAHTLYDQLQHASAGAKQRFFRNLSAEIARARAETEYQAADLDAAFAAAQDSISGFTSLTLEMPHLLDTKASLGESYLMLGRVLQARGDMAATLAALERSRDILTPIHEADPSHSRWFTLLAREQLDRARINRQRGERDAAQRALSLADALTTGVTVESLLITQEVRAQTLLELGRVAEARPLVTHLRSLGWQHDLTHRDFAKLTELLPIDRRE